MKKALIVYGNSLSNFAVHTFIERYRFKIIGQVNDIKSLYDFIKLKPDIVILEYHISIDESIKVLKEIKKINDNIRVVMIVSREEISKVSEAIKVGVEAIVIN